MLLYFKYVSRAVNGVTYVKIKVSKTLLIFMFNPGNQVAVRTIIFKNDRRHCLFVFSIDLFKLKTLILELSKSHSLRLSPL